MSRDENGTLARLKAHRIQRLEPALARHGGRLVKLTGDGALVEFSSAVDALSAAIEFQQRMAEANHDQPAETRIAFRIGLHLGDLIVDGDDLYGDGVNVAARLEAEAPTGGIVMSGDMHNAVAGRLEATFEDLGSLELKNIPRPIHAFRANWDATKWMVPAPAATQSRTNRWTIGGALSLAAAACIAVGWQYLGHPKPTPAVVVHTTPAVEPPKTTPEAEEAALGLLPYDVERIQVALTTLGFGVDLIDGLPTSDTRAMIAAWQSSRGKPATGYIDSAQQNALLHEAADAVAKYDDEQKRGKGDKSK